MRIGILLFLLIGLGLNTFGQKLIITNVGNGLSMTSRVLHFGGELQKPTMLNGNLMSLQFANLDSFILKSSTHQFNSIYKTSISADDEMTLSSLKNIYINAGDFLALNGNIKLNNYKNNLALDSVLTVDASGNLKLVSNFISREVSNKIYAGENGLLLENNLFSFGGELKRSTHLNGNMKNLRFTNLDTFFVGGRYVQFINSTKQTTISSYDSLNLLSFGSMLLSAGNVTLDGRLKLTGYKNSSDMDSVLTVDDCGRLKLISQKSLKTIAQNAFMNIGNSFGTAAYLGTNDKNFLYFKTNNIARGHIDTSGVLNYNYGVNINNAKLKTTRDIEINGVQPFADSASQKASYGINFTAGTEALARGTISFNTNTSSINYTAHGSLNFYSLHRGVPQEATIPDLIISGGEFRFGGRQSRGQLSQQSAAYHFTNHFDPYGKPKGILFPTVENSVIRDYQTAPAEGLMFYNNGTHQLEIKKPDGWHRFLTENVNKPVGATLNSVAATVENIVVNNTSFVQALGDGQKKAFSITHNLNAQFVMVQFIDCGPEANCNILQIIPKGARVELDGKNNALVTFDEAPSFQRYKIMFLRVQ